MERAQGDEADTSVDCLLTVAPVDYHNSVGLASVIPSFILHPMEFHWEESQALQPTNEGARAVAL